MVRSGDLLVRLVRGKSVLRYQRFRQETAQKYAQEKSVQEVENLREKLSEV